MDPSPRSWVLSRQGRGDHTGREGFRNNPMVDGRKERRAEAIDEEASERTASKSRKHSVLMQVEQVEEVVTVSIASELGNITLNER